MTETTSNGTDLRSLRQAARLSLWDVARPLGMTANDLSLIELERKPADEGKREEIVRTIRGIARERAEAVGAA